ncbi:hypothetical protein GCM10025866_28470 [Naasia aerilata]|uniref:Holliday junction branch migration complex subunit RuvA n=1 Tax=Naasia aerilata TaxID=1162966 RepID=A0ABM8GF06_9MICO|nr:hypothetical protein GCM10025866_28470 [Naasia aerilata]
MAMISSLRGTVLAASGASVVVEVGGIGYSVAVTPQHALSLRIGDTTLLHTALVVREDDLSLFGFADQEALHVFDLLRGVTGVGPKSALGVLAAMSPDQVAMAVVAEDDAAFRKVSGIGPKTAKLIIVSLAGKLLAPGPSRPRSPRARWAATSWSPSWDSAGPSGPRSRPWRRCCATPPTSATPRHSSAPRSACSAPAS